MRWFAIRALVVALGVTALLTSSGAVWAAGTFVPPGSGSIVGGGTGGNCGLTNTASSNTFSAPAGQVITAVAIHDGNSQDFGQDQCVEFTAPGTDSFKASNGVTCYTATGVGTASVTVTYTGTGAGNDCGGISYIAYNTGPDTSTTTTTSTTTSPTGATATTGATPELDSIVLFGVGALALSGFGIYQRRRGAHRS